MRLKGNEKLKLIIRNMLSSGRFPHALMIEGETGLGKHTLARELAEILLCEDGLDKACGNCRGCQLMKAGSHPDFKLISPNDKNIITVDSIRSLRRMAFERPDRGGKKVYIVEAELGMKADSQNALLKILEEPPEYVVFIILARASEQFLDTIVSRCVNLKVSAPNDSEALEVLAEKVPDADPAELSSVLRINDNNIGRSLDVLMGDTSEISADASKILRFAAEKKAYEVLKVLSRYERDTKGFATLLSLMEATIEIDLRNTASGQTVSELSKDELINLKGHIKFTRGLLSRYVSGDLLLTTFCAGLFK